MRSHQSQPPGVPGKLADLVMADRPPATLSNLDVLHASTTSRRRPNGQRVRALHMSATRPTVSVTS